MTQPRPGHCPCGNCGQRADSSPSEGTRVEIRSAYFWRTMSFSALPRNPWQVDACRRGIGLCRCATISRVRVGIGEGTLLPILGPPIPRIKHIDFAEARRVDEIDAGRPAIELDRDGEVVDDLEERRRRWRRRYGLSKVLLISMRHVQLYGRRDAAFPKRGCERPSDIVHDRICGISKCGQRMRACQASRRASDDRNS